MATWPIWDGRRGRLSSCGTNGWRRRRFSGRRGPGGRNVNSGQCLYSRREEQRKGKTDLGVIGGDLPSDLHGWRSVEAAERRESTGEDKEEGRVEYMRTSEREDEVGDLSVHLGRENTMERRRSVNEERAGLDCNPRLSGTW